MRVDVKFGSTTHAVEVPGDEAVATLGQLKEAIRAATGVLPPMQKLLGKPGLQTKPDDATLLSLGIKDKTKLMLIGSTAEEVVTANAPVTQAERQAEDSQEKLMRSLPYDFWAFAPFAGLLGDPYVAGKGYPLEGGSALMALLSLDVILSRINTLGASASNPFASSAKLLTMLGKEASEQVSHRFLKDMSAAHRTAIQKAHAVLRTCFRFTMEISEGKFPDNVLGAVDRCVQAIESLPVGEWVMLPAGWLGLRSYNVMFLLIHRAAPDVIHVVVINKGSEGGTYHPRWQTAEKIKACPILRFERVARERVLDRTFWLLCFALWLNRDDPADRSEFVRAEVFYDVLLPWLVEKNPRQDRMQRFATEMLLQHPEAAGPAPRTEHAGEEEEEGEEGGAAAASMADEASPLEGTDAFHPFSPFVMAHGGSVACSASSAVQSAVTAFGFLLEQYGAMSREEIKQVKFALKYEYFLRATEDLARFADRALTSLSMNPTTATRKAMGLSPETSPDTGRLTASVRAMKTVAGITADNAKTTTLPQVLAEALAQRVVVKTAQSVILQPAHFTGKMVLMYASTLAMPGAKRFATLFADTAAAIMKRVKASGTAPDGGPSLPAVEFLVLSCDSSREAYEEHMGMFDCPRAAAPCLELFRALDINRAPEIFVFSQDGTLLHRNGVRAVREDPTADTFPGGPWVGAAPLSATDVRMLEIGAAQLSHHTRKRFRRSALSRSDVAHVVELVQAVRGVVEALPRDDVHCITKAAENTSAQLGGGSGTKKEGAVTLHGVLAQPIPVGEAGQLSNADLLPTVSVAQYYGKPFRSSVPTLEDIGDFTRATNYRELHAILTKSKRIVTSLWSRASHSGTASRVAVQMHILEFVSWVFSTVVPVPLPAFAGAPVDVPRAEVDCVAAFYTQDTFTIVEGPQGAGEAGDGGDMQMDMMEAIYYLMLSLANAWQAVENPSRSFDAERCLIAMGMLIVFDAIARQSRGARRGHTLALLLASEGGYYPSTTLGKQTIPFAKVAATLELTRPHLLPIRSAMLRYVEAQRAALKHELFDLRMPDKLELRKGSTTVTFLRTFLDNCGYSLEEAGGMMSQNASEMEKLMEWLCSARTPLAKDHGEFGLYRDMVLLAKFLGTLEMRDAQLLHRRKELDALASWRLSFEEDAPGRQMSAGWRTRPAPPKWECVMVRGRDMDIADLIVKGFGDREVMYGEGLALHSPIDVSRLIEVDHPTEDDVLHAKSMPTFGGAVSAEESEVLLSCLTTPYVRIPLLLDFLSSQGRHTYLFAPAVQEVLRAALFEPAAYVSPERLATADPRRAPMRLNAQQRAEAELRTLRGDHSRPDDSDCLGTTYGLLMNELAHAPAAVLGPLSRILESVAELGPSSAYSANASYVLYVVGLVCDVMSFCRYPVETEQPPGEHAALVEAYHHRMVGFLHHHVIPLLLGWLSEAEENSDTPTQCVVYAYKSIVDRTLWKGLLAFPTLSLSTTMAARATGDRSGDVGPADPRTREVLAEKHLVSLLQDCAFVRARHGFGMGMQRTQLAAQEGDRMLTPEEKLLRFLQAQGLDTSNVSQDMLEQGRQLMMGGGRRRAVFVQIRSRFHNDTVRVPNLFHSDPTSTTESMLLKLPPADVPENILFAYLLHDHVTITRFLDAQTPARRGSLLQRVVGAVLRDRGGGEEERGELEGSGGGEGRLVDTPTAGRGLNRRLGSFSRSSASLSARPSAVHLDQLAAGEGGAGGAPESWTLAAPGVYKGPASSGLLFHAQTCELFWRNDELKPVPDSMSHFTDFENILGKDILQCGLVSRHEHRHWVHIVGTPYDVIEWSAPPNIEDQGVHTPLVLEGRLPAEPVTSCMFEGVLYDRPVPVDEEDPWPVRGERWAVEMVRQVLQRAFPGGMKFCPLAPALPTAPSDGDDVTAAAAAAAAAAAEASGDELRFIMNDGPQYENEEDRATWKEIVCYRYPQPHFELFNLVPHARKMYRSLVFSTNQRYSLHSLALLSQQRTREGLAVSAFQAGELARRIQRESTLEIHRFNELVNGREVYVPARLLQGLMPSALLESFFFWQGEDDVIRGYPLSDESGDASVLSAAAAARQPGSRVGSAKAADGDTADDTAERQKDEKKRRQTAEMMDHWFSYAVEVYISGGRERDPRRRNEARRGATITIVRREDKTYTLIHPRKPPRPSRAARGAGGGDGSAERLLPARTAALPSTTTTTTAAPDAVDEEVPPQVHALADSEVSLLHAALPHLPREVCASVLATRGGGDIAGAIEWATDPVNETALRAMLQQRHAAAGDGSSREEEEQQPSCGRGGSGPTLVERLSPPGARSSSSPAREGDRVLVNVLRCRSLGPLLEMFTNLEDPSHLMVWGRRVSGHDATSSREPGVAALTVTSTDSGECVRVESIELPRLRARFHVRTDGASARQRLYLADQPGWRVAEADDLASPAHRASLHALRDPFQQCLVLCNSTHEVALMVPNHDFTPMDIAGDPFCPLLLFDRSSYTWRESVPSPYYLYPVHTSNAFLLPATLSASLYYAVMQCATQHYGGAVRTLESCYTDSPFSPEESYMFALFERTMGDAYPDAHAVRLKLAHAVQYSTNTYQWPLAQELTGYLAKLRHVSSDCRLRRAEMLDLLRRCTKAVPLVRAQLELYAGLLGRANAGKTRADVPVKTPLMERCGFPWERLLLYPWEKISPQKLKRVTYSAPQQEKLSEGKLVEFLYKDELLADEESGANAKRGFYFLYSIKKGDLKPMLFGENVSVSFSQLLSRWFHLRHARWGREAQQDGETEMAPSWCATVLQLMEMFPSAGWPATVGMNERFVMSRGVNLGPGAAPGSASPHWEDRREERRTGVPDVFNKMHSVARELFTVNASAAAARAARSASQRRTPESRPITVSMFDHMVPRVLPGNTALGSLSLSEPSLSLHYFAKNETSESTAGVGAGSASSVVGVGAAAATAQQQQQRRRTLEALCTEPLRELGFTGRLITVCAPHAGEAGVRGREGAGPEKRPRVCPTTESSVTSAASTSEPTATTRSTSNTVGGSSVLPFNIRDHPWARAPLAQNMLDRLEEDSRRFHEQQRGTARYHFTALSTECVVQILTGEDLGEVGRALDAATAALAECEASLFALARRDAAVVAELTRSIMALANEVNESTTGCASERQTNPEYLEHCLRLASRDRVPVSMEWVCGGLLSTGLASELAVVNPFHGSVARLRAETVLLMLLSNRGFFAEQSAVAVRNVSLFLDLCRCIRNIPAGGTANGNGGAAPETDEERQQRVGALVQHFSLEIQPRVLAELLSLSSKGAGGGKGGLVRLPDDVVSVLSGRAQQLTSAALDLITAKRFYTTVTREEEGHFTFELDPRFLLFEFMFNILLRARQVEMVRWFVANILAGQSRVQQMIMGQGKTTVVGPLLALILADGTQLVTQVMPTALLEQTRGILRRCFSVVLVKHIYTLQFDRSFSDGTDAGDAEGGGVELLYQKLRSAEEDRSVVIAAPECIKSLFLKEIEQLHMLDSTPTDDLNQELSGDERYATHAVALRKRTIARSAMADAISPILQLWKRGVLIMDEVDVLLHPLRSELNFPIGLKHPIDMTGHRWLLPIHLLDAIFSFHRGRACEDVQSLLRLASSSMAPSSSAPGEDPDSDRAAREAARAHALEGVRAAIAHGFAHRSLQREPHLVLLDVTYYESRLLPALVPWLQLWLHGQILERMSRRERGSFPMATFAAFSERTTPFLASPIRESESVSAVSAYINAHLGDFAVKLLNLAHDWLHRLLPHVLSKIDRVSFGVLQPADLALTAGSAADVERVPYSRRMMAVPFVAKDVPSRSSEFAHPDVVIGLTILAFRYEGLRVKDVRELVTQLKQDFARQAGPKEHRPAARLYRRWLQLGVEEHARGGIGGGGAGLSPAVGGVLERAGVPLSQLQVTDRAQLTSLHRLLHRVPEVVHYYLCSCIFPRTMNFQKLKISACGHELGSSMLFSKRIGFSGTPSNLLPLDLGECFYEPGSDGRVLSVLTDPSVAHAEVLPDSWTPLRVLDRIAASQPPVAALIDAGALITNMDNEDVARYLLQRLPSTLFDGVVFLDSRDRQMILQRDNGLIVPVAQCGVALARRFTFFDQVHTTGTDVKQSSTATAVITLGKDLVFRDYAQGAYRMRGIGKGQRLCLYLIPEVVSRIHEVLGPCQTGDVLRDVPAWLLLNSMKVEGLQFFKLSLQELANVWRKKAIRNLIRDSVYANAHADLFNGYVRCRRFHLARPISAHAGGASQNEEAEEARVDFDDVQDATTLPDVSLLRCSIAEFRETIDYPIAARVEPPPPFLTHLQTLVEERPRELIEGDASSQACVAQLMERMRRSIQAAREAHDGGGPTTAGDQAHRTMDLNAEIVHEQEAEEEQEQEAEQEEQRVSAFSRDDEFQVPWAIDTLQYCGTNPADTVRPTKGSCFYQLSSFQIRDSQPHLNVGAMYLMSDNYYRLDWHGIGERRLKNAFLFLEWIPTGGSPGGSMEPLAHGSPPASEAIPPLSDRSSEICSGLVTLAEGESLRWLMHHSSHTRRTVSAALRFVSTGRYMDATQRFSDMVPRTGVAGLRRMPTALTTIAPTAFSGDGAAGCREGADVFVGSPTTAVEEGAGPTLTATEIAGSPDKAALLFRFFNNDMFFGREQLRVLEHVLARVEPEERLQFFVECLRVRRRQRNHWEDAPVAALFVQPDDRVHLRQLAVATRLQLGFAEMLETLAKAARPRCGSAIRKEAERVRERLEAFTEAISGGITSHAAPHELQRQVGANEEEEEGEAGAGVGMSSHCLPASVLAALLIEAFPKLCQAYSNYDVAQAIVVAVAKHRRSNARAEGAEGEQEASAPDVAVDGSSREPATIALADFFATFPSLDMRYAQAYGERGGVGGSSSTTRAAEGRSPPPQSDSPAEVVVGPQSWHCEVCTYLNEPMSRTCAMCMSAKPKGADFVTGEVSARGADAPMSGASHHAAEEEEEEEGDDVDGPWQCAVCTFINDSRSLPVCAVCLANNPNPLREAGRGGRAGGAASGVVDDLSWDCPEGYWVCSVEHGGCSKFNPNSVFYCQVCERARPNLASVRF